MHHSGDGSVARGHWCSYVQPATCNLQPATCNLQPPTCNLRPATCNLQPATCNSAILPLRLALLHKGGHTLLLVLAVPEFDKQLPLQGIGTGHGLAAGRHDQLLAVAHRGGTLVGHL